MKKIINNLHPKLILLVCSIVLWQSCITKEIYNDDRFTIIHHQMWGGNYATLPDMYIHTDSGKYKTALGWFTRSLIPQEKIIEVKINSINEDSFQIVLKADTAWMHKDSTVTISFSTKNAIQKSKHYNYK